ncbi:hypothetical protein AD951_02015 [Acetobacter malorum]|uniref:DUF262 domain-containing protein n=1 Tax=Acetobacter malorum TaxID=178901 RepID=A0A149USP0_9PROT|nr:hypothetical protein [Acetobacter malorum]KXV70938.1 hypothetical protein AD951_02015 [Acetobacter malorum]
MTDVPVRDYIALIRQAYSARGGIDGQRDAIKTTTAKRIRDRMVNDIRHGAILPPIVIGAVVDNQRFNSFPLSGEYGIRDIIPDDTLSSLAIIDGMQRTTAIIEALDGHEAVLERSLRVEFWLTKSVRAMVYRMLVLNTGQVPWTLARQLTVVYAPLIQEIRENVPDLDRIFDPDRPGRRVGPAQYASDTLVELYLAFSLRKTSIDTKEALSEEFSRQDFVENVSRSHFQAQFYSCLRVMVDLDKAFSRFDPDAGVTVRYTRGKSVFDSQPARIGFVTAVAHYTLGRPGIDRTEQQVAERLDQISQKARELTHRLNADTSEAVGRFLALDVLRELLDVRSGQVGRFERSVFFEAFKALIDERFEVASMEPCWRAH